MTLASTYPFKHYSPIVGDEVMLLLSSCLEGPNALAQAPAYLFDITLRDGTRIGELDLRIGNNATLALYAGHLGYSIQTPYRGHYYAAKACQLLPRIALEHGMRALWITCDPDNRASKRTCDYLGATFIERVRVPMTNELWSRGDREKLRYLWLLPQVIIP